MAHGYVIVDTPYRIDTLLTQIETLLGAANARAVGAN
jgi:hypothetical protein